MEKNNANPELNRKQLIDDIAILLNKLSTIQLIRLYNYIKGLLDK